MHEDILNCNYNDPFEMDVFGYNKVDDYGDETNYLSDGLTEARKKHRSNTEYEETIGDVFVDPSRTGNTLRKKRRVNLAEPWDEDQSMYWPDFEARAFEQALEDFKTPQEGNNGYDNAALLKRIEDRYGKDFVQKSLEKINRKSYKKTPAKTRLDRYIREKKNK